MTRLEQMEMEAHDSGLEIVELPLSHSDGMLSGSVIGIRPGQTSTEKTCVLAEELAHAYLTVGNILDQSDAMNRKQENIARINAYDRLIGLAGIIQAFEAGCQNRYEMAECLGVTEDFLQDALNRYVEKHGQFAYYGKYVIQFEPFLSVGKIF